MNTPQAALCVICNQPIVTESLKYVDEKGKPMHEPCYVAGITPRTPVRMQRGQSKFDSLA